MIVHYWEKQREHVVALCRKHTIRLFEDRSSVHGACAMPDTREIHVAPINCGEAYLCALHEIGHLVSKRANPENYKSFSTIAYMWCRRFPNILHTEIAAWEYAVKNTNIPIGGELAQFCYNIFGSYYNNRKKWGARIPTNKTFKLFMERKLHTLWA